MNLSFFKNRHDNQPQLSDIDWQRFCHRVQNPQVRAEKDGTLFAPVTFRGSRAKQNVTEVSMLVLDFDHGATVNEEWAIIRESGYTAALYTTHSHQRSTADHPELRDAFRICIPLATPISADRYPLLWNWAYELTGGKIDRAARDASRMFYTPVKASDDAPYEWRIQDGEPLDWESLNLREAERLTVPTNVHTEPRSPYIQRAFDAEISLVVNAANGLRNDQLNKSAFALGQFVGSGALSESEVVGALERAAKGIGLTGNEIPGTIRSGISAGRMTPRTVPENQYSNPVQVSEVYKSANQTPSTVADLEDEIVFDIGDHADAIIEYRARRAQYEQVTTGWDALDELYQPVRPAFTVVLGQSNSGKSSILDNLICNLYRIHDWSTIFFSMETQPTFLHQAMVISILANKPYSPHIEGGLTDNEIKEWCKRLAGKFIFHSLPINMRNVDTIVTLSKAAKQKYGTQALLLDPVAELSPPARLVGGMTDYLQGEITKFRQCLYDTEMHGFMVVHPPKSPQEARGKSSTRVLDPEDASGSKHFQNKADYLWVWHRWNAGEADDHAELFIKKVRRGFPGKLGSVRFDWQGPIGTYDVRYVGKNLTVEYEQGSRYGKDY